MTMTNHPNRAKNPNRDSEKQVYDVFYEALGGHALAVTEGPNGSQLRFISVPGEPGEPGGLVIVQIFADGNGWDYYIQGRCHMVAEVADDVRRALTVPHKG
jgi:hypothetical protein